MRVLLDTQTLVLAYLGEPMPKKVHALLADPDTERVLSAASILEIAVKNASGKLRMPEAETKRALGDLQITTLGFEPRHAYAFFGMPEHHRDPFDRMIIATALIEKIPLVGGDRVFPVYKGIKVIW